MVFNFIYANFTFEKSYISLHLKADFMKSYTLTKY